MMPSTGRRRITPRDQGTYPSSVNRSTQANVNPEVLGTELRAVLDVLPLNWLVTDVLGAVREKSVGVGDIGIEVLDQVQDRQVLDLIAECRTEGAQLTREVSLPRTRTHAEQELRLRLTPLNHAYVLVLIEDLNEQRRLDEVRRDFVANISHELKTPVGALSLLAEAIEAAQDDPAALANFTGRMKREAERLAQLVGDLIDLSRVQNDEPLRQPTEIDVDAVVTSALDDVQMLAAAKQIEIVVGGTGNLRLPGNFEQIASAVRNLLLNAIHYSHQGTRVAVGTKLVDDFVEISVVDQGIGIAKADQDRIFERFYRVDPARSRLTGGTGLGLAIVKHVCASHGGECRVWSNPGDGSTFTMRLPAAGANAPAREERG